MIVAAVFVSSFGCLIISVRAPVLLKAWRRSVLVPDQFLSHQPATLFPSISPGVGHEAPTLGGVAGNAAGGRHHFLHGRHDSNFLHHHTMVFYSQSYTLD